MRRDRLRAVPLLAGAAFLLLLVFGVQAGCFLYAMDARLAAQQAAGERLRRASRDLDDALRFARDEQPRLLALASAGVIGEPPRLRLLAALQALAARPEVVALDWELGPPRPRVTPAGEAAPAFPVMLSTLSLRLSLATLASLPGHLEALRAATGGASVLRGCRLVRRVDAKFDAACELDWLSVTPPAPEAAG